MRNIKLLIEYDGTQLHGWQIQNGERTVQGEIVTALNKLLNEVLTVHAAGRTDARVHALGQVANFKTRSQLPVENIHKGLNFYLAQDITINAVSEAAADFHARFDAVSRTYRYTIVDRPCAIGRHYVWSCYHNLDVAAMQAGADYLLGTHVFKAFSKLIPDEKHYLCNVQRAEWQQKQHELIFTIRANRFLHNMIRIILGTLIEVGRGKLPPEKIKENLAAEDRNQAGNTVPAHGLVLVSVEYKNTL